MFLSVAFVSAQQTQPVVAVKEAVGEAWLGLEVSKPDDTTATHLPALPPGIGFVVATVDKDGPADKAGIREHDLLWKMNEQMLVNEGQLATLLRIARPGDEAVLSVFRGGEALELKVRLGEGKDDGGAVIQRMLNDSVLRREDGPLRIVNVERKMAAYSNAQGRAEVSRVGDGDAVRIVNAEGEVIFEGVVSGRPELSAVPDAWRRQVCALRRGLDHALNAKAAPLRQPRPRIVIPQDGEKP
jgi:hypothetical protein